MPNQYTPSTRITCICQRCGTPFLAFPSRVKAGRAKFCSQDCSRAAWVRPPSVPRPVEARFYEKVNKHGPVPEHRPELGPCSLWEGDVTRNRSGSLYGKFWLDGRGERAHRVAWLLAFGTWPELPLDHLCRVTLCVKAIADEFGPAHLEPVTQRENLLRGETLAAQNARKTHCPKGHPYEGDNILWRPDGTRRCRTCERAWSAAANARRAAK